jgi:hypothetical protein
MKMCLFDFFSLSFAIFFNYFDRQLSGVKVPLHIQACAWIPWPARTQWPGEQSNGQSLKKKKESDSI